MTTKAWVSEPVRRTKIVCTIGPGTEGEERLRELAHAGMGVARLNFSHGAHEWHAERYRLLRGLEQEVGRPISILQDLSGPKLRIGNLPGAGLPLLQGELCVLAAEPCES